MEHNLSQLLKSLIEMSNLEHRLRRGEDAQPQIHSLSELVNKLNDAYLLAGVNSNRICTISEFQIKDGSFY